MKYMTASQAAEKWKYHKEEFKFFVRRIELKEFLN